MQGISKDMSFFSATSKIVDYNLENSSSDFMHKKDWITPLMTFFALPKVSVLVCKEVLKIFIMLKTSFNIIITIKS